MHGMHTPVFYIVNYLHVIMYIGLYRHIIIYVIQHYDVLKCVECIYIYMYVYVYMYMYMYMYMYVRVIICASQCMCKNVFNVYRHMRT